MPCKLILCEIYILQPALDNPGLALTFVFFAFSHNTYIRIQVIGLKDHKRAKTNFQITFVVGLPSIE